MRRTLILALLSSLLVMGITVPRVTSVSAVSRGSAPLAKKTCTTKKVHGKKKGCAAR